MSQGERRESVSDIAARQSPRDDLKDAKIRKEKKETQLLQRMRDLMLECRAVAEQLAAATERASTADSAERIAYGIHVAALEEGLLNTLQHAVGVLSHFSAPAGPLRSGVAQAAGTTAR